MNALSVCPVCQGRGFVPFGFYTSNGETNMITCGTETCRTCGGTGIVWQPNTTPVYLRYPTYRYWPSTAQSGSSASLELPDRRSFV